MRRYYFCHSTCMCRRCLATPITACYLTQNVVDVRIHACWWQFDRVELLPRRRGEFFGACPWDELQRRAMRGHETSVKRCPAGDLAPTRSWMNTELLLVSEASCERLLSGSAGKKWLSSLLIPERHVVIGWTGLYRDEDNSVATARSTDKQSTTTTTTLATT